MRAVQCRMLRTSTIASALFLLSLFGSATGKKKRNSKCLTLFDKQRDVFAPCLTHDCILFKKETPIVKLNSLPPSSVPFRCSERTRLYPKLYGIFFTTLGEIAELSDAYCVYAGECSYDDLVYFLQDVAAEGGNKHRFIAGDALFVLPYRITLDSEPSAVMFGGSMMILGPQSSMHSDTIEHVAAVVAPFGPRSWTIITLFFGLLFVLRVWLMVQHYGAGSLTFRVWYFSMLGEFTPLSKDPSPEEIENRAFLQFWAGWWTKVTMATIAIVVLFYELGVVNFIFNHSVPRFDDPVDKMDEAALKEFAVVVNSAQDYFFRQLVDPQYADLKNPPWNLCDNVDDCFKMMARKSHPALYGITSQHFGASMLHEQKACDKYTIFELRKGAQEYKIVWYYGHAVPREQRIGINRRISILDTTQRIRDIFRMAVPDSEKTCGSMDKRPIPTLVILLPLLLFSGSYILVQAGALLFRFARPFEPTGS